MRNSENPADGYEGCRRGLHSERQRAAQSTPSWQQHTQCISVARCKPPTGVEGGIDRSLFNTEDNSDGNAIFRKMAAAGTPFVPKNPQHDHTGEPCSYFTKPLVRPDGGGLNAYADGSAVAYGRFYYLCENRRWVRLGPTSAFSNTHEVTAERVESRAQPVQVYDKE